jgi:hypothetical protein
VSWVEKADKKDKKDKKAEDVKTEPLKDHFIIRAVLTGILIALVIILVITPVLRAVFPSINLLLTLRSIIFALLVVALIITLAKAIPFIARKEKLVPPVRAIIYLFLGILVLGVALFFVLNSLLVANIHITIPVGNKTLSYQPPASIPANISPNVTPATYKPAYTERNVIQYKSFYMHHLSQTTGKTLSESDILPNQTVLAAPNGKMTYASSNCYKGDRCLFVDVDDSDTGWLQINSEMINITPGAVYNFTWYVNCISCNESAYMAVFWMAYDLKRGRFAELYGRSRLALKTTNGYAPFTLLAKPPLGAQAAIFGLRVHTEGCWVQPRTVLYIDGI